MKLIKQAIIGIIGLSVVVLLFSLLLPSETHGRRGIVINRDREQIMSQVNDFVNWKNWHPNFAADTSKIGYGKITAGAGGSCELERVPGKLDLFLFQQVNDTSAVVIQRRKGENDIKNIFTLSKDASTNGTYVDWKFISKMKWYPWEKFSGFFTESFTAPGMMLALENLKKYTETASPN